MGAHGAGSAARHRIGHSRVVMHALRVGGFYLFKAIRSWHAFSSLPFLIVIPLPVIVGRQISGRDDDPPSRFDDVDADKEPDSPLEIGYFLSAGLFTTAMILPFFFWHRGYIVCSALMTANFTC
jgi:hypothetical protein